jgi:transcriptional regulator with XRE-family HTH domain
MSHFVNELKAAIEKGPSTQVELADAAGINRGLMSLVLNGKTGVTPRTAGRLCAVVERSSAARLLAAYLEDVSAEALAEQRSVRSETSTAAESGKKIPSAR